MFKTLKLITEIANHRLNIDGGQHWPYSKLLKQQQPSEMDNVRSTRTLPEIIKEKMPV